MTMSILGAAVGIGAGMAVAGWMMGTLGDHIGDGID